MLGKLTFTVIVLYHRPKNCQILYYRVPLHSIVTETIMRGSREIFSECCVVNPGLLQVRLVLPWAHLYFLPATFLLGVQELQQQQSFELYI